MYVTDGSLPQNNQMPLPAAYVARGQAKLCAMGSAIANARATADGLLPDPLSFSDVMGRSSIEDVRRQQNRLLISSSFLGKTQIGDTPQTKGAGVQVVSPININATIPTAVCAQSFRKRSAYGPRWGDASASQCMVQSNLFSAIGDHPWLWLGAAALGAIGLAGYGVTKRRRRRTL